MVDTLRVGQAVLQKVVAKLGDRAASQLGLTQAALTRFLNGTESVPDRVLLRAVDIVLDEFQQAPSGKSQPFDRSQP